MMIIKDERKLELGNQPCKNCGKIGSRMVPIYSVFVNAHNGPTRGYEYLCFECFGPRIIWRDKNERVFETPASAWRKK